MQNLICATILTGIYDVNQNQILPGNSFEIIEKWYHSISKLALSGIVFYNELSQDIIDKYQNKFIRFIKIDYNNELNTNAYRYVVYQNFLNENTQKINNVFFTDITDVEVIKNPFVEPLFLNNQTSIFCGNEPKILNNEWMQDHNTHLRNQIPSFIEFENENANETLLNCGIIGGNLSVVKELINGMVKLHLTHTVTNKTPYTLDMGVFNYVARTQFKHQLIHGEPVNTEFKKFENDRTDCWFRHK